MSIRDLIPVNRGKNRTPARKDDRINPLLSLYHQVNSLFDEYFRSDWLVKYDTDVFTDFPKVDIKENDKEVLVTAEVPGMDKDDIDISVSDNILTLRGERRQEKEEKKSNSYRIERAYGSFYRDILLPAEVESDGVSAELKKGILKMKIPKKTESKRKYKKIEIHS